MPFWLVEARELHMGVFLPDKLLVSLEKTVHKDSEVKSDDDFAQNYLNDFTDKVIENVALFLGIFGILRALMRFLVVDVFAIRPFAVSMAISVYMFYIWFRMKHGVRLQYPGEKVVVLVTLNTAYLVYLSGGLIGPIFPMLVMLPLLGVMLCGRKGIVGTLLFLAPFMTFIFHLNISDSNFQVLKISPMELFQMRALLMVITTAIVAAMSWYFVTSNQRLLEIVSHQANTDYLTGLLNRRSFEAGLADEIKRATRCGNALSVVIMDIDNFKQINDSYGHQVGDKCLIHLANIIRDSLKRPADIAGRYGGEEFVLVLPETDSTGALFVAEMLRRNVVKNPLPLEEGTVLPFTISLGVSSAENIRDVDADRLLNEADNMMYMSKEAGKNKVKGTVLTDESNQQLRLAEIAI